MVNTAVTPYHGAGDDPLLEVVRMVCDRYKSPHTKRAYRRALLDFLAWRGDHPFTYRLATAYQAHLSDDLGLSAQNVNQRLSAIRALAREARENDLLDAQVAASILTMGGVKAQGRVVGQWLTREQAQTLLNLPDPDTLRGARDRALLAILLGAGLRRSEMVVLTFAHVQQREGRWAIVNIKGKGNKVRTVPVASWVKTALDNWRDALQKAGATSVVFRPLRRGGHLTQQPAPTSAVASLEADLYPPLSAQTIHDIVARYSAQMGIPFSPHDLRRTYAKLARQGGAPLEQIQFSLGHVSVQTTEKYVGMDQDFGDAPGDRLGLTLTRKRGR